MYDDASTLDQQVNEAEFDLISQLKNGSDRALNTIVRSWAVPLYRFAYVLSRDANLAEDVVQNVFVYLWEHRESLDPRRNLKAYLFQAVRNRTLNALQHERALHRVGNLASQLRDTVSLNEGEFAVDQEDLLRLIRETLASLPPRSREIFLLRQEEGMEYHEIAAVLGIGIPTIHNQMSRASKAIAQAIDRWRRGE